MLKLMPAAFAAALAAWSGLPGAEVKAGAAAVKITPPAGVPLAGYYSPRAAEGVHDDLWSKALVLEEGGVKAALVALDLIGTGRTWVEEAREEIESLTGIPGRNVMISATHAHTGPVIGGGGPRSDALGGRRPESQEYRAALPRLIAESVWKAARRLSPARVSTGIGREDRLTFNRRFHMKDGSVGWNPGKLNPGILRPAGPTDPEVPVALFEALDGKPLAACVNFAMHLDTVGGLEISADYPFTLSSLLAQAKGPEMVTLFTIGAAGDLNHVDVSRAGKQKGHGEAARIGAILAARVLRVFDELKPVEPGPLVVKSETVKLPLAEVTPADLEKARRVWEEAWGKGSYEPAFLETVHAYKVLEVTAREGRPLEVEVQVVAVGEELAWVGLPGEVFVELGLAIKSGSPYPVTVIAELANGSIGYIPTRRAYPEGNYEVVSARCAAGSGEILVDAALRLLRQAHAEARGLRRPPASPLSPERALAAFRLEPGLAIDLVAAEPQVADPVAMAFDAAGRLFVAENRGYPLGPGQGKPPAGTIALLEDPEGDGTFTRRGDFASGLTFPNGVMAWKQGVIVTCAPDLLYLEDADGDGRAEDRKVLLTGFDASNTTQLRVSHPTLGLDGWIYLTSGLTGGSQVRPPGDPGRPPVACKTDSRFHPFTGEFEPVDGRAQFGQSFDDLGRRFICMNRVQVQHVVLPSRYLKRNPHLAFSDTQEDCPEGMLPEPLKGHGGAARIYPLSDNVTTADSHAGTFTAACAVHVYRGTSLPEEYRGNVFSCDPTGNLVHRDLLVPRGAGFLARRAREGVEVVASTDNWFRPVFLATGPDGALYVCDMYRKTIEHPQYLPDEVQRRTDFESGKGMGRIYRLRGTAKEKTARPGESLAAAGAEELCRALSHPNAWRRETARRLLLERREAGAASHLRRALGGLGGAPLVEVLRALDALGDLEEGEIAAALRNPQPGVREQAVQLAEGRLKGSEDLAEAVIGLAEDPDARVRFRCALALGEIPSPGVVPALGRIAVRDCADRWARAAALSSAAGQAGGLWREVERLLPAGAAPPGVAELGFELGRLLAIDGSREEVERRLQALAAPEGGAFSTWRLAALHGFAEGAAASGRAGGLAGLDGAFERCRGVLADAREALPARLAAAGLLAHADFASSGEALLGLLAPGEPAELQHRAVASLGRYPEAEAARALLEPARWEAYTHPARELVVKTLLERPAHVEALLLALEAGGVPPLALSASQRGRLQKSGDEAVRRRAEKVFGDAGDEDRRKVFEELKPVLARKADGQKGLEVFKKHCANCHRLDREGVHVGPDLFGMRNQPKEAILLHTIIPNQEIVSGFAAYEFAVRDGRTLLGLLSSESPTSVTVRQTQGLEETLLRASLRSVRALSISLMPDGLEKHMTREELADLIAFLKGE